MKSVFIDFISAIVVIAGSNLYQRYALTPDLTFEWQAVLLYSLIAILWLIYRYAKTHITQVYSSSFKVYLLTLCIAGITLGSFSQDELHQLGFNFAMDESKAIRQYFELKAIFFAIGAVIFPKLLGEKPQPQ